MLYKTRQAIGPWHVRPFTRVIFLSMKRYSLILEAAQGTLDPTSTLIAHWSGLLWGVLVVSETHPNIIDFSIPFKMDSGGCHNLPPGAPGPISEPENHRILCDGFWIHELSCMLRCVDRQNSTKHLYAGCSVQHVGNLRAICFACTHEGVVLHR